MIQSSAAVAECAPEIGQAPPDSIVHEAHQLAMRSIERTVHDLRGEVAEQYTAAVADTKVDMELAQMVRERLIHRAERMAGDDNYRDTAFALVDQLTQPSHDTLGRALEIENYLMLRDQGHDPALKAEPQPSSIPTGSALTSAINTYRLAQRLKNEDTVRQMLAYFKEWNLEVPPAV